MWSTELLTLPVGRGRIVEISGPPPCCEHADDPDPNHRCDRSPGCRHSTGAPTLRGSREELPSTPACPPSIRPREPTRRAPPLRRGPRLEHGRGIRRPQTACETRLRVWRRTCRFGPEWAFSTRWNGLSVEGEIGRAYRCSSASVGYQPGRFAIFHPDYLSVRPPPARVHLSTHRVSPTSSAGWLLFYALAVS